MPKSDHEKSLEEQIAKLEAQLEQAKLKSLLNETMIDIAEEQLGIPLWNRAKRPLAEETKKWIQIYKQATYKVNALKMPLRIGQPHLELDEFIEMELAMGNLSRNERNKPITTFAFLTAYNPMSKPLDAAENAKRNKQLQADLRKFSLCPGTSSDQVGKWVEESFLVIGIDITTAKMIARNHRQRAFLFGHLGKPITIQIRENESDTFYPIE